MSKYTKQKCIHCLEYFDELTEDHILPDSWYPDSTPSNLEKWTAPACERCNSKLGKVEEALFDKLSICFDENDIASSGLYMKKLLHKPEDERSAGRQAKFLMDILKSSVPYLYDDNIDNVLKRGTPKEGVRTRNMIRIPGKELYLVSKKIIKGLEFKLRNRLVSEDIKIEIIIPHANNEKELKLINKWEELISPIEENTHRGYGFVVNYGVNPSDEDWIIYNVLVWNHLEFWAMLYPKDNKIKETGGNINESMRHLKQAVDLYNQNNLDEALICVDSAINLNKDNFSAYKTKADIFYKFKKNKEALEALDVALQIKPNSFRTLTDKVSLLGLLSRYDEANIAADQALKLKFDDYYIWHKKGISLYCLGKYSESIDAFNECLKINPYFSQSIKNKISALILAGRYRDAVDLFKTNNLSEDEYNLLLNNIGYALLRLGEYCEANEYLEKAENLDKTHKEVYYNLYKTSFHLKHFLKFLEYFLKFLYLSNKDRVKNFLKNSKVKNPYND